MTTASSTVSSGSDSTMNDPYQGYERDETPANSIGAVAKIIMAVDVSTHARSAPWPPEPNLSNTRSRFSIASRIMRSPAAVIIACSIPIVSLCLRMSRAVAARPSSIDRAISARRSMYEPIANESSGMNTGRMDFAVSGSARPRCTATRSVWVLPAPRGATIRVCGREPSRAAPLILSTRVSKVVVRPTVTASSSSAASADGVNVGCTVTASSCAMPAEPAVRRICRGRRCAPNSGPIPDARRTSPIGRGR